MPLVITESAETAGWQELLPPGFAALSPGAVSIRDPLRWGTELSRTPGIAVEDCGKQNLCRFKWVPELRICSLTFIDFPILFLKDFYL